MAQEYQERRKHDIHDRVQLELQFCRGHIYANTSCLQEMIAYLETRIGAQYNRQREVLRYDQAEYSQFADELVYKKPWAKLKDIHKTIKMREYVKILAYEDQSHRQIRQNREQVLADLEQGLRDKRMNKNGCAVDYNEELMCIEDIPAVVKRSNGLYKVRW